MTALFSNSRDRVVLAPVAALLIALSLLGIHGSSVGALEERFGDVEQGELIAGTPRPIRSDEWQNTSPMIIAQVEAGLPRYNPNMINDQGTSVAADLPEWGWHLAFEPQSWPFAILPSRIAFAMHWWILMFLPFYAATRFAMRLTNSLTIATAAGIGVTLSSLLQWWFLATTAIPVACAFLIATFAFELLSDSTATESTTTESATTESSTEKGATEDGETGESGLVGQLVASAGKLRWPKMIGIGYWGTVLAVTVYPPFQIMAFWSIAFFAGGLLYSDRAGLTRRTMVELGLPSAAALTLTILYALTNADIFSAFSNAEYPAVRSFESGAYSGWSGFNRSFGGILDYKLRIGGKVAALGTNESEASGVVTLVPLFVVTGWHMIRRGSPNGTRPALHVAFASLAFYQAVLLAWMFAPKGLTPAFRVLIFAQVPPRRIMMGLLLSTAMLLILSAGYWRDQQKNLSFAAVAGSSTGAWVLAIGGAVVASTTGYTTMRPVLLIAFVLGLGAFLLVGVEVRSGVVVIAAVIAFTGFGVHPLYSGLGYLDQDSPVLSAIDRVDQLESGRWLVDDFWIVNLPAAAGAEVLAGTQYYGDLEYWQDLAPNEPEESLSRTVLRSAHVLTRVDTAFPGVDVEVLFANQIGLQINPCSVEAADLGRLYMLSPKPAFGECTRLIETIPTSNPLYIHQIGNQ